MRDARSRARARSAVGAMAVAAVVALASTGIMSSSACATHACDGSFVKEDQRDPSGNYTVGKMVDDDTWESGGIDDPWLDFPAERTYEFHLPIELRGRAMLEMIPYVSVDQLPNASAASNWALGSGNLGEFLSRQCTCFRQDGGIHYPDNCDDAFLVRNDTCGEYFLRVVVRFARDATNVCVTDDGMPVTSPDDAAADAPLLDGATDASDAIANDARD